MAERPPLPPSSDDGSDDLAGEPRGYVAADQPSRHVDGGAQSSDDEAFSSQGSAYMVQRAIPGLAKSVSTAPTLTVGTRFWSKAMHDAIAPRWDWLMQKFLRAIKIAESCAGLGTVCLSARCLGLPFVATSACDKKPSAQAWLLQNEGHKHVYESIADQTFGGWCFRHGTYCTPREEEVDDLVALGPPCQPFSDYRSDKEAVPYIAHRGASVTLGSEEDDNSTISLLHTRRPRAFLMENVTALARRAASDHQIPLLTFIQKLNAVVKKPDNSPFYTSLHMFEMNPFPWIAASRPRTVPPLPARRTCQPH